MWDVIASVLWFGALLTCVAVPARYARRARAARNAGDHGLDVIKATDRVT